jgi:hypothetical protein
VNDLTLTGINTTQRPYATNIYIGQQYDYSGVRAHYDRIVASTYYIGSDTGWSNATKTLNSTVGTNVQWCVYANDTSNNWNYSSCINPFSLTTISGNAAPQYFQSSANSTIAGKPTLFSLYWTDDIGLGGYIFSTNNTGTWVNDIFTYFNITTKIFGNNNNGTSSFTIGNAIMGKNYTIAENGISKSITARINTYGLARNVKCAIYDNSNNFVAETQENSVNTGSMAWVVFNFNISNQKLLYANQLYHLVCWTNGGTDLSATYIVGENTYRQSVTYGTWPNPYVPTLLSNTNKADIYVNYTPSNALFADGFESGNLNAWDGTAYSGGTLTVQNSVFYNGGYASNFTSMSTGAAVAYKAITPGTDYYISSYIRLSAMPTGSSPVVLGAGFAHSNSDVPSWALIAKPIVQFQGGNAYWGVRSIYGGGTSSQNYLESTPSKPTANTWYQVEMHSTVGTSGQFQLWVNGVLKVNQTNVDNSARGNIGTACILLDSSYGAEPAMNLYVDDVVASTSYINPENMGWSNVTKTLNSTAGNNVQWCVYANDTSNNWNMTSCSNPFSLTTTSANCDIFIGNSTVIPYTFTQNNKVYCLASNISSNYTCLNIAAQNVTLDCQGYTINYCQNVTQYTGISYYAIAATSSYDNITIKNCRIVQQNSNGWSCRAISTYGTDNSTIKNNTITTVGNGNVGIYLSNSSNNLISANNITTSAYGSSGIALNYPSYYNNIVNNIIFTTGIEAYGIDMAVNSYNNITGGSIIAQNDYDYYIGWSDSTNNFTNTNFTTQRSFEISGANDTWFVYSNDSSSNIWLKTTLSENYQGISRRLINWNQTLMKWNDTFLNASGSITARYNITGLISRSLYDIYNNSVLTYSDQYSGDSGILSFTINLPQNQWRNITVIWKIGMP